MTEIDDENLRDFIHEKIFMRKLKFYQDAMLS
jgi:hypothetical protein